MSSLGEKKRRDLLFGLLTTGARNAIIRAKETTVEGAGMEEKKEINYEFRERLSAVHKPNRRNTALTATEGEITLSEAYAVTVPADADAVLLGAARDLVDYFSTSMGIYLRLVTEGHLASDAPVIAYSIAPSLGERSYRLSAREGRVELCGVDSRRAAQAGYYLEDLLNLREAPFLPVGEEVRTALFSPRMAHSGYGLDMFPTEYLRAIAHAGIDALLLFVTDVDMTPHGYHDFNDICRRAAAHGLDVYAYSYLANKMHPEEEGAEAFYEDLYGHFLDRCPYFRGIIFVGESCEFPSRDPHTTGVRRLDNPKSKSPIVDGVPAPGWWPCEDYPALLTLIARILRRRRPDFDVVFWSYNWCRAPYEARRALIDALPKDVTLQATYEMGETVVRDGIENRTTDYTLFFPGPGYYFRSEAEAAHENGLRFYSMTNTGGRTWDIGVAPYLPAPYQWMKRYEGMRRAHEAWGLSGTMECHHYGFVPSIVAELAKWAFHSPMPDLEGVLRRIVARDFLPENADAVLEALRCFSDAVHYQISTNSDQYGPCRVGPAFPYLLFKTAGITFPSPSYAHFGGNTICHPSYHALVYAKEGNFKERPDLQKKMDYEIECYGKAIDLYTRGMEILTPIVDSLPSGKRDDARRLLGVGHFIRNTLRTAVGAKRFFKLREVLLERHGVERNATVDAMLEICRRELENAEETIPLVEFDSMLGYEPSMEYMCDRAHIEWKIALLSEVIGEELPSYYE